MDELIDRRWPVDPISAGRRGGWSQLAGSARVSSAGVTALRMRSR